MDDLLISIIVPIYNSEQYLDKCIQSIINQTYRNIEIILVNDGSTDNSLSVCEKYQKKDGRIQIVSQENQGLICARITGLNYASGNFIGFVDSDDWIEECMYEKLAQKEKETAADLISSGFISDNEIRNTQDITYDNYEEGLYDNLDTDIYPTMLHHDIANGRGLQCSLVNKLFKKSILCKVYEDIETEVFFGEDCLAIYTYCLMANSIYIMKDAFYHYLIRKGSMCRTKNEKLATNSYLLYKGLKKQFMKYEKPDVLMRQLKRYILQIETHNLSMLYDINVAALGDWTFHYDKDLYSQRIAIYGAGGCGQALYRQILRSGNKENIAAWVDKEPEGKTEQCCYPINAPSVLGELEFEYLIIAVKDEAIANQIRRELVDKICIEESKIIWKKPEYKALFEDVIF